MNAYQRLREIVNYFRTTDYVCASCGKILFDKEMKNEAWSKDKTWEMFLCNKCAQIFKKTRKHYLHFKKKKIYWMVE